MNAQMQLIDVPKDHPSTAVKITAFKKQNGIITHRCAHTTEARWMAVKIPPRRLDNGGPIEGMTLLQMAENFCRLLDEGGWTGYGNGELTAIRDVCENRNIPCNL